MNKQSKKYLPEETRKRIIQLRRQAGLSQKKLAEKIYIPQPTLSIYETGKKNLNFNLMLGFSKFFNVSLDWLIYGDTDDEKEADHD